MFIGELSMNGVHVGLRALGMGDARALFEVTRAVGDETRRGAWRLYHRAGRA